MIGVTLGHTHCHYSVQCIGIWLSIHLSHKLCCGPSKSSGVTYLVFGVPQGSILGPILFVMYTVDLLMVIKNYGLSPHMYADDTQAYGSCRPSATKVSECEEAITSWMRSNRLQPNPEKTEVLWCATARRQYHLPTPPLLIDGCSVSPVKSVCDLGIYIDSDLTMQTHVKRTVSWRFASLCRLRQIRHLVPTATLQMVVVALVHSRLDYTNSVLAGLPAYLLRQLQSVLNAAARLVYHLTGRDHITDVLIDQSALVAVFRTDTVQNGCSDIQSPARRLTTLPQFIGPCCRRVWSTSTSLCRTEPFADSIVQTVNHRCSSVSGRSSTVLEQAAWQRYVDQFVDDLPAITEAHTVPAVIPRHYHVTLSLTVTPIVVLAVALLLRPLSKLIDWSVFYCFRDIANYLANVANFSYLMYIWRPCWG